MIKKILLIFKILLNAKFIFSNPKNKELLIFDGNTLEELKHVIAGYNYSILETRIDRVREIYLSKEILYLIINNFQKNIFNSYLLSIIDQINPKIIFTYIDNSYRFSEFSKLRGNKYRFIALQNGARYEHKILNELIKKKIIKKKLEIQKFHIPHFLCFGKYEIDDYRKNYQIVKNFTKVGSLKLSNYLLSKKNIKNNNLRNNDILLISDVNCWDLILDKLNYPIEKGVITLIKFTIRFAIQNRLKIKIAARSQKNHFYNENIFYKKNLTNEEYRFLLKNIFFRSKNYKTYEIMQKSKITIGTMSTMLRENLYMEGKTLACNFTKTNIFDFPIKGICSLNDNDFDKFEKRAKKIISISKNHYMNLINKKPAYLVFRHQYKNTIDLVKMKLSHHLGLQEND
jgi:surface carbohydrate biosynthesis protein